MRRQDTPSGPAGGREDGYIEGHLRHRKRAEGAHAGRFDLHNGAGQCLEVNVCLSGSACQGLPVRNILGAMQKRMQ